MTQEELDREFELLQKYIDWRVDMMASLPTHRLKEYISTGKISIDRSSSLTVTQKIDTYHKTGNWLWGNPDYATIITPSFDQWKDDRMDKEFTTRGFGYYEFKDSGRTLCSIQSSSSAMEDKIWFGATEIGLQHFKAGQGWRDVELTSTMEEHYVANNRMHLNQKQVKKLLPILQRFVDTGEI